MKGCAAKRPKLGPLPSHKSYRLGGLAASLAALCYAGKIHGSPQNRYLRLPYEF